MESLDAINFEDLFDFSPEPLNQEGEELVLGSSGDQPPADDFSLANDSTTPLTIAAHQLRDDRGQVQQRLSFPYAPSSPGSAPTTVTLKLTTLSSPPTAILLRPSDSKRQSQAASNKDPFVGFDALGGSNAVDPEKADGSEAKLGASVPTTAQTLPSAGATAKRISQKLQSANEAAAAAATAVLPIPSVPAAAGGRLSGTLGRRSPEEPQGGSNAGEKSKRGRKPGQKSVLMSDMKSKLERSRQSARECRARKKLRYQYLDDLILEREKANVVLREELLTYQRWCHELDQGRIPDGLRDVLNQFKNEKK